MRRPSPTGKIPSEPVRPSRLARLRTDRHGNTLALTAAAMIPIAAMNGLPVSKHIAFMTDGIISTSASTYSAYGVDDEDDRVDSTLGLNAQHVARFQSACSRAKSMGITIWVIALDVADTSDIEPCATSSGHFETSDGTDLEDVFARIGAGIGRLRLTR